MSNLEIRLSPKFRIVLWGEETRSNILSPLNGQGCLRRDYRSDLGYSKIEIIAVGESPLR